jgi:hypothetical protein
LKVTSFGSSTALNLFHAFLRARALRIYHETIQARV